MSTQPTLVTAVFDLGRDTLNPPFRRDKDHYRRHLPAVLSIRCPMVVYTDAAHRDLVRELREGMPTAIVEMDPAILARHEAYAQVHAIRTDPQWLGQSDWLADSPQAALEAYNPVVLSKLLWLHDQAMANPFGSERFYWIDAGLAHTVHDLFLDERAFRRLTDLHQRFLLLTYPYEADREVSGFDAAALARLAGVDRSRWVARGGFFGGPAALIDEVASRYDDLLGETLDGGLMGTEESLLTILSYRDADLFDLHFVPADGLIHPFFGRLIDEWPGDAPAAAGLLGAICETWFQSFNTPLQFERLLESIQIAAPGLLTTARRVLINNSTNPGTFAQYDAVCARFGVEQIREGNRGIHGGHRRAAELFARGGAHAMFWFEDDMLLFPEVGVGRVCADGLPRFVHGLPEVALGVQQREFADYVKLSYSEGFISNAMQQAAWNVLAGPRRERLLEGAPSAPPTRFSRIGVVGSAPYAVGEVCFSNWPHLIDRRGTRRILLGFEGECSQATWIADSFEQLRDGALKAAVLLASPVDHSRIQTYPAGERTSYQEVEAGEPPIPSPPQAAPVARPDHPFEPGTIFVSVANYRDSETPKTVASLFANAARPERIHVGVFSQVVPGDDDDCLPQAPPVGELREVRVHASQSLGACWARSRVQEELMHGEEYFLQIDSHSRFEPGWDETLIEMLGRCSSDRPIITTYPPSYVPPADRGEPLVTLLVGYAYNELGILLFKTRCIDPHQPLDGPLPGAFLSGNCLFGRSEAFREVPYDPWLYFHGEEISLAVRLWTHGWDLYAPDRPFMYHDYSTDRGRPRNWDDRKDWHLLNQRSFLRLRHLFGIETSTDPVVLRDIERYGLGEARTLAEYEEFTDVNFAKAYLGPRAADGHFPHPTTARALALSRAERARYRDADAGADLARPPLETRSGTASTMSATKDLRPALARWLADNGVRRLVDAGCGDFNWMQAVDLSALDLYVGYDITPEIIAGNQQLYGGAQRRLFAVADIVTTPLAACDAVLCRHVLDEAPEEDVRLALDNFRATGARWLLATGVSLLGEPLARLPDYNGELGVWRLDGGEAG